MYYRLARLLFKTGDLVAARRKVLESLEEAPRYRAALRLLLEIEQRSQQQAGAAQDSPAEKDRP